jgi:hypothetical protein
MRLPDGLMILFTDDMPTISCPQYSTHFYACKALAFFDSFAKDVASALYALW